MVEQEKAELNAYINELAFRLEKQDAQLREMDRVMAQLRKFLICLKTEQVFFKFIHQLQIQIDGRQLRY